MPTDLPDDNASEWSDDDQPSKSQRKRDARAHLDVAERLGSSSESVIDAMPLPDNLRKAVNDLRSIKSHGARKRQRHYLAKLLRHEPETTSAILQALDLQSANSQTQNRQFHTIEVWRDRLLDRSDQVARNAVTEFAELHPDTDIQTLRQMVRACRKHTEFDEKSGQFIGNQQTRLLFVWLRQNIAET